MNISKREKLLTILNKKAIKHNEVPVSCIITKDDKIISKAYNNKITKHDPTAHAEIIAIRKAAKKLKTWNLNECRLYVTLYPCKMCLDVINEARIKEVYYILDNEKEINNNFKITKINSEKNEYFQEELKGFFKNKR
jgi:tRNA(adenine34) deaminase